MKAAEDTKARASLPFVSFVPFVVSPLRVLRGGLARLVARSLHRSKPSGLTSLHAVEPLGRITVLLVQNTGSIQQHANEHVLPELSPQEGFVLVGMRDELP